VSVFPDERGLVSRCWY